MSRESVLVCEGYLDRAFWHGMLMYRLGCRDQQRSGPWGEVKGPGVYGMTSPTERPLRIVPTNTRPKKGSRRSPVFEGAKLFLEGRETHPIEYLILNIDDDSEGVGRDDYAAQLLQFVQNLVPAATAQEAGQVWLGSGEARVALLPWRSGWEPHEVVPNKQTLERLVAGALREVYPERAQKVAQWLASRPDPAPRSPKEVTWSYMAGWHAELGCEAFLKELWRDAAIADALVQELDRQGLWQDITTFAA